MVAKQTPIWYNGSKDTREDRIMEKWSRIKYMPCLPLGDNRSRVTGCEKHIQLAREAAQEGIVLLKNNNSTLPLQKGARVAIFGTAQIDYIKGGGGSGVVYCEYTRNIYEGLKQKSQIEVYDPLSLFYEARVSDAIRNGELEGRNTSVARKLGYLKGNITEAKIPEDLLAGAKAFTDTAIITICRYSAEYFDRYADGSDPYFELSPEEALMVETVCNNFDKVIVLLNTGAMIESAWFAQNDKVDAALMVWQGGMEGGLAVADVLVGEVTPSGKLVDTCAKSFGDYPSSAGFHESPDYVKYEEDIFVGYRYFETIPGMAERVVYPFGFGLSYTAFEISNVSATALGGEILVSADVQNVGAYAGKEVVQVYYAAPEGKLTKAARSLCAFAKTRLLSPGERQTLTMRFEIAAMASYDDLGVVQKSAYVLEAGAYRFFVGNSVRDAKEIAYRYVLEGDKVTEQLTAYCTPTSLEKRLTATGAYVDVPATSRVPESFPCTYVCAENIPAPGAQKYMLIDVAEGRVSLDDFIAQLTDDELYRLLGGKRNTGVTITDGMGGLDQYGIPTPMTADGPAGVRVKPVTGISTTAFPVETMLACTWNLELVESIGVAVALEVKENNMAMWLAPALNIHRSPLCGRNFEYFSEDPFVSGKMAAAIVRGTQSQRVVATIKHFACNNKETNRKESDSVLSERALREIYLRGFEICVKESAPLMVMTSYNLVNGVRTAEHAELIQGILRGEWGFNGVVTTDWHGHAERNRELAAGNDIHMPCASYEDRSVDYIDTVPCTTPRNVMAECVKRLLEMILWLE